MAPASPSQNTNRSTPKKLRGGAGRGSAATQPETELPGRAWCRKLGRKLLAWYDRHARVLPWRRSPDPYHVWLSEIMLQQTRVDSVIPYYERFLAAFPSVDALAQADPQQVLRLWEGLGYYRRAMQLHRAARIVVQQYGGQLPSDPHQLRQLPGIGRYTAGAICSIAFEQKTPILEANTLRLYARLIALAASPYSSAAQRRLWRLAEKLLPEQSPGRFNQAAMELGSQVCTAANPSCGECPVAEQCETFARSLQAEIPPPKRKPPVEQRREIALLVGRQGKLLLFQCNEGRWAGLWDFPCLPVSGKRMPTAAEFARSALGCWGLRLAAGRILTTISYSVTRFRFQRSCVTASHQGGPDRQLSPSSWRWIEPHDLDEYPLCRPARRLAQMLTDTQLQ